LTTFRYTSTFFLVSLSIFFLTCKSTEDPTSSGIPPETWLQRAHRDIGESRWQAAKNALNRAREGGQEVTLLLAEVKAVLGEWQEAAELFENILQDERDATIKAKCYLNLGLIAKKQGDGEKAIAHFSHALEQDPNTPNAHYHIAEIHRRNGQFEQARIAYLKAIEVSPTDAPAVQGAVLACLKLGKTGAIAPLINQTRRRVPNHPLLIALQSRVLAAGVYPARDNAGIALALANQLDPEEPSGDHLEVQAMAHAAMGDFSKASELQTKAIEKAEHGHRQTIAGYRRLQLAEYNHQNPPHSAFAAEDPVWQTEDLDPQRDSPYGLLPEWRRPNRAMADRIAAYADSPIANHSAYLNDVQAGNLKRKLLRQNLKPEQRLTLQIQYAIELLRAGRTEAALGQIEDIENQLGTVASPVANDRETSLGYIKAIAYLRLAEQENCLENHTTASCLFPIAPEGVHRLLRGAQGAITQLKQHLATQPDSRSARWLLNLAYMLLGDYPDGVPSQYRIDGNSFEPRLDLKPFRDVSASLGLDRNSLAGGSLVEDFNGDGFLDILTSSWGPRDPLQLLFNRGSEGFVDATEASGLDGIHGGLNLMQTDYDNDGNKDVLILRGAWLDQAGLQPNSLLRNLGNGRFEDVTESAGLLSFRPTQTAVWLDFDNDGWLDLFVGNETVSKRTHHCELFHNQGDGTFIEIAAEVGLDVTGFIKGVTAGDIDGDGWVDLFISRYRQTNFLMKNRGPDGTGNFRFEDVSREAGVTLPLHSFPTWFWDYDNDGDPDLFVADYNHVDVGTVAADLQGLPHRAEASKLYRNRGDGTFEDVTEAAGLARVFVAMGCNFGDFDNDGNLDFYLGTGSPNLGMLIPNRMFGSDGQGHFRELTATLGLGHLQKGHGVSFADLDHDGDQDIHTVLGGAYSGDVYRNAMFENPGYGNRWLTLELVGTECNRAAIGSRVAIEVSEGTSTRTIYRWVTSGGSFGASPLRVNVGLGKADQVGQVRVTWAGKTKPQVFEGLRMNAAYRLTQNGAEPEGLPLPPVQWANGGHHRHDPP